MIMKKLFTSVALALALGTLSANAKDYTCPLTINMMGTDMSVGDINVTVDKQENGKYTLKLINFDMAGSMLVGNIIVEDVEPTVCGNTIMLNAQKTIQITAGDKKDADGNDQEWMGPALGDVSILLKAQMKGDGLKALLNIPVAGFMIVNVKLGDNADSMCQLPNSGFEEFHTATYGKYTSDEPNGWHTFMSATGDWKSSVAGVTHTWISDDVRNDADATSKQSVKIASSAVKFFGAPIASANGTITTGRLQAGSTTPESPKNCSFLDFSHTEVDGNGDPFYTVLNNKPDSLKAWVKFHAGKDNKNPTATISALLTTGEYAQDPDDGTHTANIIAKANTDAISSTDEWQQITLPFVYSNTEAMPKAALVTISTCAVPSGGSMSDSDPDILYVDDVELVYKAGIKSIKFNNEDISDKFDEDGNLKNYDYDKSLSLDDFVVEADGAGAFVTKKITSDDNLTYVTLTVTSNDLSEAVVRTITFTNVPTGIKNASVTTATGIHAIYNLAGQQVSSMTSGKVYIVKTTDGQTKKIVKK